MPKRATQLRDTQIDTLQPTDRRQQLCDGKRLWFVMRPVTKSGLPPSRTWEYRYVSPVTGKTSSVKLGSFPAMGVADARRARDEQAALVARGLDPAIERRRERATKSVRPTRSIKIDDAWLPVLCMVRYACGRSSYIVSEVCDFVRKVKSALEPWQLAQIAREVSEHIRDGMAGMDMDVAEWSRLVRDLMSQ